MVPLLLTIEDKPPTLEAAQAFVGGYVQMINLEDGSQLLVNEEGLLKELFCNYPASILAGQFLVGNAIRLKGTARWS